MMFLKKNKITFKEYRHLISKPEILGMISDNESAFLHYYASTKFTGIGDIVDLGTWLGSSTFSLAKGLAENRMALNKDKRIFAYDLFTWEESLDHHVAGTEYDNMFNYGDDYRWLFLKLTKPYESFIETKGNVFKYKWNGRPIEFLFIDAMKSIETTHLILKTFYPCLIPKRSLLAYQDFDHYLTPWIHLLIYIFRQYFIHVHDIPWSGSTVFKLIKPLPDELIHTDLTFIDEKNADKAFHYCMKLACTEKRSNIAAAHIMYYYYHKQKAHAKQLLKYYFQKGYNPDSDLKFVKQLLADQND